MFSWLNSFLRNSYNNMEFKKCQSVAWVIPCFLLRHTQNLNTERATKKNKKGRMMVSNYPEEEEEEGVCEEQNKLTAKALNPRGSSRSFSKPWVQMCCCCCWVGRDFSTVWLEAAAAAAAAAVVIISSICRWSSHSEDIGGGGGGGGGVECKTLGISKRRAILMIG